VIGGKYFEMFALGLRNMRGFKLRSFLTMLGISFGIASVISMLALGEGAQQEILSQIGRLGIRNIIVNSKQPVGVQQGSQAGAAQFVLRYGLTFKDLGLIEGTVPTVARVLPVHTLTDNVWIGSRKVSAKMKGVHPEHLDLFRLSVEAGRSLTALDEVMLKRVCVVRTGLLRALEHYEDPIGTRLQIGDEDPVVYEIVGVLRDEEFTGQTQKALNVDNQSLEFYAPYQTVLERHGTASSSRSTGSFSAEDVDLHQIVVEAAEEDLVRPTARMLRRILEYSHPEPEYEMIVPLELLEQRKKAQQVFNIFLFAIALISLVVGGIGIANIMLASITERTREIGVRRALGAKRRHIIAQFLTETVTLAAFGGILGLILGLVLLIPMESWTGWSASVPPWAFPLSIGISCVVGILSGLWPAFRAARMDPIAALRYE
jgi:putative ABC transport system permease protein